MNQFGRFKFFHACTILLALTFVGIKSTNITTSSPITRSSLQTGRSPMAISSKNQKISIWPGKPSHGHSRPRGRSDGQKRGRIQKELKLLYDLRSPEAKQVKHSELKFDAAQIASMETYGPGTTPTPQSILR